MSTPASLPDSIEDLQHLVLAMQAEMDAVRLERDLLKSGRLSDKQEIERLTLLLAKLRRLLFGQKSEKLVRQIEQLELELEELHIKQGDQPALPEPAVLPTRTPAVRQPLPEHLPRDIQEHLPHASCCPDCGGAWQRVGEDVSEVLDYVPASLRVVRHVRPRFSCRQCDRMVQALAPSRPLARSYAGAGLLSHIMVSKYLDHLPLYRQSQMWAREDINLSQSTLGDWVGGVHQLLRPLINALHRHVFSTRKLHADDTPIAVLAPGTGKTRQARLWVYARDERPSGSTAPPAVWFRYSPDRKGIHPQTHLKHFEGILQADAYAGFNEAYRTGKVIQAGCWAHARRKFHDIHVHRPSDITRHVLAQIGQLYEIEAGIRGSPPLIRQAVRQEKALPIVLALYDWFMQQLPTLSRKSVTTDAIQYALNQWQALTRYLEYGEIEIDNNAAERALRSVAVGRKNYLFLGSDAGGERAATLYSLLGTAKLNGINPEAYLRHVLTVIGDYPVNRVDELLPWRVQL